MKKKLIAASVGTCVLVVCRACRYVLRACAATMTAHARLTSQQLTLLLFAVHQPVQDNLDGRMCSEMATLTTLVDRSMECNVYLTAMRYLSGLASCAGCAMIGHSSKSSLATDSMMET